MRNNERLIGITCGRTRPPKASLYESAVRRAGGRPVFLLPAYGVGDTAGRFDGFIIPGGLDPAPSYYHEKTSCAIEPEETERTDFELSLLSEIIKVRKPVLGICYGMQVLNIFMEGSLIQDIHTQLPGALDHRAVNHTVRITDNPFLPEGEFIVNSSHHQAVGTLGRGLRVFAISPDGLTEAFFLEDSFFFAGFQWHPERMNDGLSDLIFRTLIGACNVSE